MLHPTRLPNFTGARMAAVTLPVEEAGGASSTHAENELAAFEAASRRSKASITKLSTLGAESSWPHGHGTWSSETSFASSDKLPASASSSSLTRASNSVAAAVLHARTAQGLRSSITPSISTMIGSSASLRSQSQMQQRMSAAPTTWQELVTLSRKAQMSPTPAKNLSDTAVAPMSGKPIALLPAATDEHLLQRFISPQALRGRHQLPEAEVQRLYRVLHVYSLGFHQVLGEVALHATDRRQLLTSVWKAFAQLWEEALQVSFASEVAELVQERDSLVAAYMAAQDTAAELQQQNGELHERLRSLVGGAITRMAREKACKGHMASLESQLHLLQEKEAQLTVVKPPQVAPQTAPTGDSHSRRDAAQKQAVVEKARRATPIELKQAEVAVQEKQVLLRQAYKQSTAAEAKCKQLQQQLDQAIERSLTAEAGRDDSNAKLVAASTELRARRTAYELLHTDWLASQEDLKAHRHVLARLDSMSNDVKKMHSEHAAMQGQLIQAEARAQAAEARCLELEALGAPQQQQQQELAAAFGPVLAQATRPTSSQTAKDHTEAATSVVASADPAKDETVCNQLSAHADDVSSGVKGSHLPLPNSSSGPLLAECSSLLCNSAVTDVQPLQKNVSDPQGAPAASAAAKSCQGQSESSQSATSGRLEHASSSSVSPELATHS